MYGFQRAGLGAIRVLRSQAVAAGDPMAAVAFAEAQKHWDDRADIVAHLKAGVGGTDRSDLSPGSIGSDFLAALHPLSVVGRLQNLRRLPPRVRVLTQLTPTVAHWAGESRATPMSAGAFVAEELMLRRVSAQTAASLELIQDASIDAETALLNDLLNACAAAVDVAFLDPSVLDSDNKSPAAVTSYSTAIEYTGSLDLDLKTAVDRLVAQGGNLRTSSWVCSERLGATLALMRGSGGSLLYPDANALGGQLLGLPLLTSSAAMEADSDGSQVALIDAAAIAYAESAPTLRTTSDGMIELSVAPTGGGDVPDAATATLASLWQTDCVAFVANMHVAWTLRRPGAVQTITGIQLVVES